MSRVQLNIFNIEKAFMMSLGILTLLWKPMFNSNIFYFEKLVMNRDSPITSWLKKTGLEPNHFLFIKTMK
jgi:hypothetical protein